VGTSPTTRQRCAFTGTAAEPTAHQGNAQALGEGVKVNALAPGLRRTNLQPGMSVGGDPAEATAGAVRLALLPDDGPTRALWSWDGTRVPW
jgi:hypothetical protein